MLDKILHKIVQFLGSDGFIPLCGFFMIAVLIFVYFFEKNKIIENRTENFQAIVSELNFNEQSFSSGKQRHPQLCNSALFKAISGEYSGKYFTLNSCDGPGYFILKDSWVYNHRNNDTVFFRYLKRDRFFEIKERN